MNAVRQKPVAPFYEFGPFRVDTIKYVLTRNGEVVPLNLKAFEILLALIENRGQVLEKNELLQRVWPDTIVEENNLARHISALRKALDEQPNEHQYILTVPGRGYRFVAGVREVDDTAEEFNGILINGLKVNGVADFQAVNGNEVAAGPAPIEASEGNEALYGKIARRRQGAIITTAAIAILAVAILAISLISRRSQGDALPPQQRKLWQLTFDPSLESEPSWSPDGRMIAYSSDQSGNFDIWVRPVGEGNPARVTTSEAHDWQPDWAPEGNLLVFRSERDGGGLFVTPVFGGKERKVSSFGYNPRWSPDGKQILFYNSPLQTTMAPKIYVAAIDGQPPREVMADFLPQFGFFRVAWRPDGKHLSLWGWSHQDKWRFLTIPLDGGTPIKSEIDQKIEAQIREEASLILGNFMWAPSGRALYFEGLSQSVKNLWKVDVDPQSLRWIAGPERLTTGAGADMDIAISPDGRKLAFTTRAEQTRVWALPFDATSGRIKGEGRPLTAAGVNAVDPDLSPDGRRLAFVTRRAGKMELWEKSLKDGRETLLGADELSRTLPHWSYDGSRLVYHRSRQLNLEGSRFESSLVLAPVGGGAEQTLTTLRQEPIIAWDWSRDGKWILGGSWRQPERFAIYLLPIAAAPQAETQMRLITSHPEMNLYQARFSPDQKWISFNARPVIESGTSTIYVVPASGGEWRRITEAKYSDDKPRWSPDGRRLYFVSNRTGFFNVWGIVFDPESGQPRGEPFRVTNFESPAQMILPDVNFMEMALATDRIVLPIMEVSGGIWILENVGR